MSVTAVQAPVLPCYIAPEWELGWLISTEDMDETCASKFVGHG